MNKKILISVTGIAAFLIAGALTMFLKPVEKFNQPEREQKIQTQPEVKAEIKEPEIQTQEDWYVYVTGEVKNPGVYKVSPDSRFFHAVEAAGGFTSRADKNSINMAERLIDGFQIYVAAKNERKNIPAPQPQQNNSTKIPGLPNRSNIVAQNHAVLIDINNASAKELEQLKGVGPAIAKRIVDYRKSHGRFSSPEDLINVRGIGEKTLEKMRPQILIR